MKMKKTLAAALAAVTLVSMSVGLAGCGKKGSDSGPEYVYVPEYIKISGDFSNGGINNAAFAGDKFYFISYGGSVSAGAATEGGAVPAVAKTMSSESSEAAPSTDVSGDTDYKPSLYTLDLKGAAKKLDYYKADALPAGKQGSVMISDFDVNAKGQLAVIQDIFSYTKNPNPSPENNYEDAITDSAEVYSLIVYDADGKQLAKTELSAINPEISYPGDIKIDDSGNIYLAADQSVYVMDTACKPLYTYKSEGYISGLTKLPDGRVCAGTNGSSGAEGTGSSNVLVALDNTKKTGTQLCKLPNNAYNIITGNSDYGAYYSNGAYLFGLNVATGEQTQTINWISCDIDDSNINSIAFLSDGRVACISSIWNEKSQTMDSELALLTKTKASSIDQKKVLTLAMQYVNYDVKSEIISFNKTNPDYRINVIDYSVYNTDTDYEAGLKKMKTEILSGDVPDIIYMSGINKAQLASKGIIDDLGQFMDKDKEVTRDSIMPNILKAMESDGKIYSTSSGFSISTVLGPTSLVGDKPGWTVDQLMAAYAKMPKGSTIMGPYNTQSTLLTICLNMDMSDYVDWSNRKCSFDSVGFKKLLEFAKNFPAKVNEDQAGGDGMSDQQRIAAGTQMLSQTSISTFEDYQYNKLAFSGKMTFIGYPTENGVGNSIALAPGFAISAKCSDKDGAWQFVRNFMTEKYQTGGIYQFPTNKDAFAAKLKEAMTPVYEKDANGKYVLDKNGSKVEQPRGGMSVDGSDKVVNFYALSKAEADDITAIINATTNVFQNDENITKIVSDGAAAYFSGAKSADEVAKLIQSQVSIYINEQS